MPPLKWFTKERPPVAKPVSPAHEGGLLGERVGLLSPVLAFGVYHLAEENIEKFCGKRASYVAKGSEIALVACLPGAPHAPGITYYTMENGMQVPLVPAAPRLQEFFRAFEACSCAGAFMLSSAGEDKYSIGYQPYMATLPTGQRVPIERRVIPFTFLELQVLAQSDEYVEDLARCYALKFGADKEWPDADSARRREAAQALEQQPGERDEEYVKRVEVHVFPHLKAEMDMRSEV